MRIYSIFNSIDGEVNAFHQGCFTTFIRTVGCNLSCEYCDTEYALREDAGKEMSMREIVDEVKSIGCHKVTITGGEPLIQKNMPNLIHLLVHSGFVVTVETNGSIVLPGLNASVALNLSWIVDFKIRDASCMELKNYYQLTNRDFIKCVISSKDDFLFFKQILENMRSNGCVAKIALSPAHNEFDVNELVALCKQFKMFDIVINVQLHKLLDLSESA